MTIKDLDPTKTYVQAKMHQYLNDVKTDHYMLKDGEVSKISDTKFYKLVDKPEIVVLGPITEKINKHR